MFLEVKVNLNPTSNPASSAFLMPAIAMAKAPLNTPKLIVKLTVY
jgi:hypothetical protein